MYGWIYNSIIGMKNRKGGRHINTGKEGNEVDDDGVNRLDKFEI